MAHRHRHALALAAVVAGVACANHAWSNSTGSPACAPVASGMSASPHGAATPGTAGFSIGTSSNVITGGPLTIQFLQTANTSFKGVFLTAEDASGAPTGTFTAPSGYKLMTCGGSAGTAITTDSNTLRPTPVSFTWTPPATVTGASDSVVTISGVVVVSLIPSKWYVLTPIKLHRAVAGVGPDGTTGVRLAANTPNPFGRATLISYTLADWSPVRLAIQDAAGRRVRLLDEGYHPGGRHDLRWDGLDDHGRVMPPGVYFYRLEVPGYSAVRRAVMLAR